MTSRYQNSAALDSDRVFLVSGNVEMEVDEDQGSLMDHKGLQSPRIAARRLPIEME